MDGMRLSFVTGLLCVSCGSVPAPQIPMDAANNTSGSFVWSREDHIALGAKRAKQFAATKSLGSLLAQGDSEQSSLSRQIVRVESRDLHSQTAWTSSLGTGSLWTVQGEPVILTARHVVGVPSDDSQLIGTLHDGGHLLLASSPAINNLLRGLDLAILSVVGNTHLIENLTVPELGASLRSPSDGDVVAVLGYPGGGTGFDGLGAVRSFPPHFDRTLYPVFSFAEAETGGGLTGRIQAGLVPPQGMSGSPIFDSEGRVAGLLYAVASERLDGRSTYQMLGIDADVIASKLQELDRR